MSDKRFLLEVAQQILEGIRRVEYRFARVNKSDDFLKDDDGLSTLDSIGMMLIAIGESLKKFERAGGKPCLEEHPEVDWKGAKGIRDFLSHNYFDIDAEVVFVVCEEKLSGLKQAFHSIEESLKSQV